MAQLVSTVWMIHAGTGLGGVKGDLALEGGSISFHPEAREARTLVFDLAEVQRVRRVLGSPVLELRLRRGEQYPVVGFYFVQPPNLPSSGDASPLQRRSARRSAILQLVRSNASKKEEIGRWVQAINRREPGGAVTR